MTTTNVSAEKFVGEVEGLLAIVRGGLEGWRATRDSDSVWALRSGSGGFKLACSTLEQIIDRVKLHQDFELRLTVGADAEIDGRPGMPTYSFRKDPYDVIRVARLHRSLQPGDSLAVVAARETLEYGADNTYIGRYGCMVSMRDLARVGHDATLHVVKLEAHEADLPGTQSAA